MGKKSFEEAKIEKPEPTKETIPTLETGGKEFDVEKYEKGVEKYQETRQEIEKESQKKDLEYFEEVKQKYPLEPEVIERTEEYLKKEKYEVGEDKEAGKKEEKIEKVIEEDKVKEEEKLQPQEKELKFESDEELKEYFKNRFLELLEEQVEKTEEFKRKWESLLDEVPPEEINYLIVQKALENLADDPKMPKEKGKWLKATLRSRDIARAAVKEAPPGVDKEPLEPMFYGASHSLINELKSVFPEDVIKRLESIRDKMMKIERAKKERKGVEKAREEKERRLEEIREEMRRYIEQQRK